MNDEFLVMFSDRFKSYRNSQARERLLEGIQSDAVHGQMTVRDALVFLITLATAHEWRTSHIRIAKYNNARRLSQLIKKPTWYLPVDVEEARHKARAIAANQIEAYVALAFAHRAGYRAHSRKLWRCIEHSIQTDAWGNSKQVRDQHAVDTLFANIRSRLTYQYRKKGVATVEAESAKLFTDLAKRMQKAAIFTAPLYSLYWAKHRDT